jgi:hypothetical protein
MPIAMYDISIPMFIHMLQSMSVLLQKGAAYAAAKKIDPATLPNSRLFPDMLPLAAQVQIATDSAKGCAARLAGQQSPVYEDNEKTLEELIARVQKTIDYLNTFNPLQINGAETRTIEFKLGGYTLKFNGQDYLQNFAIPNFYFHVTTTYNILRHNGVDIGKQDYLGKIQ